MTCTPCSRPPRPRSPSARADLPGLRSGPTGIARAVAAVVAAAALVASLLLTSCRIGSPSFRLGVLATALVPYAVVGYGLGAVLLAVLARRAAARRRRLLGVGAGLALAGLLFHAFLLVPLFVGGHPHGRPDLVVMTANLRLGQADPASVVSLARRDHVDVLVLEEVTPEAAAALAAAGLRTVLGHAVGTAAPGAAGTVVLSRFPLSGTTPLATGNASYRTRVEAPRPFWLLAIHPSQPLRLDGAWSRDWAVLDRAIGSLRGPRLVAGDFNSVLDHAPVRAALRSGLRDAAEQANSGWQPTWPSRATGPRFLLGLVLFPIDHVLASEHFAAVSTSTYDVPGTDHRALVARFVAVPG